jgi:hypothetical protein
MSRYRIRLVLLVASFVMLGLRASEAHASPPLAKSDDDRIADGELDPNDLVGRATVGRGLSRATPGGEAWLSVEGFSRRSMLGEREVGGFLVVGLPFDRFARMAAHDANAYATPTPISSASGLPPVTFASATEEPVVTVTPRLARASVEAAWRTAGLGTDDSRLDAVVSRARWSALLPETRLRAIRYDDQTLYTEATSDTNRLRDTAGANVGLEARLTWRFDHLLYADDEPSFERMRLERHDARSRIAGRVLEALFHWHRSWLEVRWAQAASREAREAPGRPSRDEIEAALRVSEAEATLDVLTGGWFSSSRDRAAASRQVGPPAPVPSAL